MSVSAEPRVRPLSRLPLDGAAITCLGGSVLAVAAVPLLGSLDGTDGAAVAEQLSVTGTRLQIVAMLAVLASAALLLAAVRLGRAIPGTAGTVATVAGSGVAVLLAAYYSAFAAGVVVGEHLLTQVGPGLGESTLVAVNLVEMTRYAPGLALVATAVVARKALPAGVVISAGALLAMCLVPMGTWFAAILIPIWLGIAGALSGRGAQSAR